MKKISWCWRSRRGSIRSVDAEGKNITDAFLKMNKLDRERAIKHVQWIEIDGVKA
jgi:hypothetical protein